MKQNNVFTLQNNFEDLEYKMKVIENDMKKRPEDLAQINEVIKKGFDNNFFK